MLALLGESAATVAQQWLPASPCGETVAAVAIDPNQPSTLYAGTWTGIFKSLDAGMSWHRVYSAGFGESQSIQAIALNGSSPQTVLAAGPVELPVHSEEGPMIRSTDGGASWSETGLVPSWAWPFIVSDPSDQGTFYAGTSLGPALAVYRTRDAGLTWENLPLPITSYSDLAIDPADHNTLLLSAVGTGLGVGAIFRSTNGGASWQSGDTGLAPPGSAPAAGAIAFDPSTPNIAYVAGSSYTPRTVQPNPNFFRSIDGGLSWSSITAATGTPNVNAIATSLAFPGTVYIATADHGVLQTQDHGNTWTPLNASGLPSQNVSGIWASPSEQGVLYAVSQGVLFRLSASAVATGSVTSGLCLGNRFTAVATFQPPGQASASASPTSVTLNTGAFWFFDSTNLELVVKVLDGRAVNGHWWVFYGALSNVEYTITVTDTQTGAVKTYFNPQGNLASVADTSAF